MKRILNLLLCLALLTGFTPRTAYAAPKWPDYVPISAEGGIVMDADSGAVLYGRNIHVPYFPASITKILTALVVLENCDMDETVTFSRNAVYNVEPGSSSAGLDEGDELCVRDCLYAMMLKSANEAANALAEHTAGSIEEFAVMMNEKASSLGCKDSHFNNPSGLNDPDHYTSAYDMALIARAAFANEAFVEIDSSLYYALPETKKNPDGITVYPGHKMMKKNSSLYYPGIIGGKTGYTSLAGNTLVTCAERDGMKLIAVVLNGQQTHYPDTKALLDFGFANFKSINAAEYDTTYTSVKNDMSIAGLPTANLSVLSVPDDFRVTLPNDAELSDTTSSISYELPNGAPERAVAQITYTYGERLVGSTYLMRSEKPVVKTAAAEGSGAASQTAGTDTLNEERDVSQETGSSGTAAPDANRTAPDTGHIALTADRTAPDAADRTRIDQTDTARSAAPETRGTHDKADSPFRLHIPNGFWIATSILAVFAVLGGGLMLWKAHIEKAEEAERLTRYKRRQERLQDIGMSQADFDLMLQEKRTASALKNEKKKRRPRKHRSFLDDKKF